MNTTVIGIDFSTDPNKMGLARATVNVVAGTIVLHKVLTATAKLPPVQTVAGWVRQVCRDTPVLIAIDAPLGWPKAMRGHSFVSHSAGEPLEICADQLFSRETDREIEHRVGKKPLEVGANLIARSAHGALRFLRELSRDIDTDAPLPLAWSPFDLERGPCVVEVYPGATMKAHRIPTGRYKKKGKDGLPDRHRIANCLRNGGMVFEMGINYVARNDYLVDAAVCVLAGRDFVAECAAGPDRKQRSAAQQEGWIWVHTRSSNVTR